MGRGMGEGSGIMKGVEKREPLPQPPTWIPAWAVGRSTPYRRRYIPAVGEVRGQGMKVPVYVNGEVSGQRQAVQKMPPPPHSTRYCTEPSGRTLRARTRTGSPRDR